MDSFSVLTITRCSFRSSLPLSVRAGVSCAGSELEQRPAVFAHVALEGCGLRFVVEEEPQGVDEICVVVVFDVLRDRVHLVWRRRQEDDTRRLTAVVAEGKELLSELPSGLVRSQQVLEALEFVQE